VNPETAVIKVGRREIGASRPVYIVAELSGNHRQQYDEAVRLIEEAKNAGADAVKVQAYTPDTLTIDCDADMFRHGHDSLWAGKTLYELYSEAYTPWDWLPKLKAVADRLGLDFFATPFDESAVDFLEPLGMQIYKVASFEIVDIGLLRRISRTGKPVFISTGMATMAEIDEAVAAVRQEKNCPIALLKCTSAYPAPASDMNLRTIPHLGETFGVPVGLSDHSTGIAIAAAAVSMGARIVEKHFTLSRSIPGPDVEFSLEPKEFREMVEAIRTVECALGKVQYGPSQGERESTNFRRSLFAVSDIGAGEVFTRENLRSIRPGYGLHPRYLNLLLGKRARTELRRGTPIAWQHVLDSDE
jgi:pseudaminic acid synthase